MPLMITLCQGVGMLKCSILRHSHMRMLVLVMLLSAMFAPAVLADVQWEEDGWLATIGSERLEKGDEFGCYGMPNLSWKADPGAVALECREYIENRIDASKWDSSPISTYTPNDLDKTQHATIASQGFRIHGDNTGQSDTAWHNSDNSPEKGIDWHNLGRRGGSLEKGIAEESIIEKELDSGGLVNMYWVGRIHDATVRHDKDVIDMLAERDDVWFTTWGEAYSYWASEQCTTVNHSLNGTVMNFELSQSTACRASLNSWNIPTTWVVDISEATVLESDLSPLDTDEKNTMEGWRQEGSILYISILAGKSVNFSLSDEVDYEISGRTQFFNNKSSALTVGAHSTTDLFLWSKRFDEHDFLKFTWLITPRALDDGISWLPYAGIGVLLVSVSGIWLVLKKDALMHSKAEEFMPESYEGDDDE